MNEPALFRPAPHVAWRRVGGEVVLLDLKRRAYFSLNDTGAEVWELLRRGLTEGAAAEELADAHGQPLAKVRREVSSLVARLRREGLLAARAAPPPRAR